MTGDGNEAVWRYMQKHLGYSDEELARFKSSSRNQKILDRRNDLSNKTIIFEVVQSHGCNVQHKVGDRFFFSPAGYMLTAQCPKRICASILPAMTRMTVLIQERIYEGLDPTPQFCRGHCDDVGLDCGGWGRVVIEARVIARS